MQAKQNKLTSKKSRIFKIIYLPILFTCLLNLSFSSVAQTQVYNQSASEYAVKAAYIYNILRFVSWNDNDPLAHTDALTVCLHNRNPFEHYLEPIRSKRIGGKEIRLRITNSPEQWPSCHLIFLEESDLLNIDELKEYYDNNNNILIGDDIDFVKKGGLFGFYIESNKVKLGANENTITNTRFNISSLLIEVCQLYGDPQ